MAAELGADSLFYLPLEAVARCIGLDASRLCRGCLTGKYPDADRRAAVSTLAAQPQRQRQRPHLRTGRGDAAYLSRPWTLTPSAARFTCCAAFHRTTYQFRLRLRRLRLSCPSHGTPAHGRLWKGGAHGRSG